MAALTWIVLGGALHAAAFAAGVGLLWLLRFAFEA